MSIDAAWFNDRLRAFTAAEGSHPSGFPISTQLYPCDDRHVGASFDSHYARCDLWASQSIKDLTAIHVDVGSRVDGFCTHVLAAGGRILHVDIRDPGFSWRDFEWRKDDARTLATFADESVSSLSCLHVAEHVGIPRYSSDIDPHGMTKCMASLARILQVGGVLFFACPIGRHRTVFNAHRVASPRWVVDTFLSFGMTLVDFSAVDDAGVWHQNALHLDYETAEYSCGCFRLVKR